MQRAVVLGSDGTGCLNLRHHLAMHRPARPELPPDLAAVADLLARVRARVILEADGEPPRPAAEPLPGALATLPAGRLLLRVEEVAEALAISRSAVYALIRSGRIPAVKIGRSTATERRDSAAVGSRSRAVAGR